MTMNEKQLLELLLTQYGVEAPSPEPLRESGGHTYLVSGKEKYLLKVIGAAFLETARQSVSIMRNLEKNDFPVPRIILTKNGEACVSVSSDGREKLIVLMEYIDGDEPDLKKCAAEVGTIVGSFHRLMDEYPAAPVSRGRDFFIGRYLDHLNRKGYPRLSAYRDLGERLWEKVGRLPQGICHGDLHRGNLLQRADGKIVLVDFDTVCRAPLMFDLSVLCDMTDYFSFKPKDAELSDEVFRAFLSGYSEYRTLCREELLSFPDWLAIRHFQLQATILEIYGADCIDEGFIDAQLAWLDGLEKAYANRRNP